MADETKDFRSAPESLDEILAECIAAEEAGRPLDRRALARRYPQFAADLDEFFGNRDRMERLAAPLRESPESPPARRAANSFGPSAPLGRVRYFGDYELLDEVAAGGMGIVYKARQVSLNRIVAVKMILKGTLASEDDVKRFRAEAEAAANLQHPGIVAIHEVGLHEGQHYFSMDFVEGESLAERLRDRPLAARDAARYVSEAAQAVHYAHQQGTLHRDLKPSNILIDRHDRVRITDFGLAKRIEDQSDLTLTGQILGTPSYMPPEQALGKRSLIGAASDVYALGAVLYELLAGRPPFRGETPAATLREVETLDPVAPRLLSPATPRDLETICLKCLEKEPHKRYGTAELLADDLARFLRGEPILARPISRPARVWRLCRRHPLVSSLAAAVVLLLLVTTVVSTAGYLGALRFIQSQAKIQTFEEDSRISRAMDLLEGPRPDFPQAELLFSEVIARRPNDADLLLRRAAVRFARANFRGALADANQALRLRSDRGAAARFLIVEAGLEAEDEAMTRQAYQELLERDAGSTEEQMATSLLDPRNAAAFEQMNAIVEQDPHNYQARYYRAWIAHHLTLHQASKRYYDIVVADAEHVLSARPYDLRARQVLCATLVQFHFLADETDRPLTRAKELLDHWLAESPHALGPLVLTSRWHLEQEQAAQALEICRQARDRHIARPELAYLEAQALLQLRRFQECQAALDSLGMLLEPRSRTIIPVSPTLLAVMRARLALALQASHNAKSAVEAGWPSTVSDWTYDEWYEWTSVLRHLKDERASDMCEQWRKAAPECPGPEEALGRLGGAGKDPLERYNTALKLAPSLRQVRLERGKWLASRRGAYREALSDFEAFVGYLPHNREGTYELARLLLECPELTVRDVRRARDLAQHNVQSDRNHTESWELLAKAEMQLARPTEALAAIDEAVKRRRSEANLLQRSDILIRLGRFAESLRDFDTALKLTAQRAQTLQNYALRLAISNHGDAGLYQRALELAQEGVVGRTQQQTGNPPDPINSALGVALYRAGQWEASLRSLPDNSMREGFFRVMALARLGRHEEAWRLYQTWSKQAAIEWVLLDPAQQTLADLRREAASLLGIPLHSEVVQQDLAARQVGPEDWPQWGGWGGRNNVALGEHRPMDWSPGSFDRRTGTWHKENSYNVKWGAKLGSQTYGNPVVANGRVFVGTNNSTGYLKRYPRQVDLGVLLCFREEDGAFLWQHSSEKLPTGRVHDWPMQGICSAPLVEGDRLWFVTNRGEVRCLDTLGFHDGEDDGRAASLEPARLFEIVRRDDAQDMAFDAYVTELDAGRLPAEWRAKFEAAEMPLPMGDLGVKADEPTTTAHKQWTFQAAVRGEVRTFQLSLIGKRLAAFKLITPADQEEADVVWQLDMMKELGVSQHNMCTCAPTAWGDALFICTSNGVDDTHQKIPAPHAPSFIALDKHTGQLLWTDNSPGANIHHGQWSAPAVAMLGGVPQVIFGGGDGWVYSFHATQWQDGKPELLWKFDVNPKDALLDLGGRGTRNEPFAMPVIYDGLVYITTGQDPEHGEGIGSLWCIDPTRRGDVSPQLAVHVSDRSQPIPHKRVQAVVAQDGEVAIENPNSAVIWHYREHDSNENGKIEFEEQFHRTIASVVAQNDVLLAVDFSGLAHCLNAKTGKLYWTYDTLAAVWATPLAVGDHVYIGDEDGDLAILRLHPTPRQIIHASPLGGPAFVHADPLREIYHSSSIYTAPILANGVLYLATQDHLFAIHDPAAAEQPISAKTLEVAR